MEQDVKIAVELYKNYQITGMHFYKSCCMHDLIYTNSCKGVTVRCPYFFATDLWNRDCILIRLNIVK